MGQTPRPVDAGVAIGHVFLGKYRVDQILGHGGMGVVAKCTHLQLNDTVAIKMLRRDVMLDRDAVERFMREAQAAVKLRSEYVARVSDVGTFENGAPYMVMEFLDGHDLGELIDERGCLPAPWAIEMMLQAAEALAEAHSIGIVHRDVKPTNLFVTWRPDGSALIKVLDFGISKAPIGTDMQLTQTQSLLGTPAYMSPEQMRSARLVDARSDIWSLGTVMYELLEGRRPFEAESFSEMCVKVAVDPPQPMVNTPPALQQVVLRCLAKSPEQRYASMAELGRDLIPFAQDPRQAAVLVERMQRMVERGSHVNWDGHSSAGVRVPQALRDAKSAPIAAPAPNGTDTEVAPLAGVPQTYAARDGSAPARAPSEVPAVPRKRRIWLIAALALLLVGGGIGALVAKRRADAAEQAAADKAAADQLAAEQAAAEKAAADKAAADKAAADKAAADKAAADKAAADQLAAEQAAAEQAAAEQAAADKLAAATKRPIKRGGRAGTKPATKTTDGKPASQDTAKPPCDVYMYPHGCPR